jgi:hypothetical protein
MKRQFVYLAGLCMSLFFAASCGPGSSNYTPDAAGFAKIQDDLKSKFGNDAYYSDINIIYTAGNRPGSGITLTFTVTKDPASLKMEEWTYNSYSNWNQASDVTIEIPEGTDIKEFLYQLSGKFDLKKMGELVEVSAKKLADEKQLKNAVLDVAMLNPGKGQASSTDFVISMKPENGGTTFNFRYDLDGNLLSFDY